MVLYRGVQIEALHGDITKLEVDAIVNVANAHLLMGGGVAGAIKRDGDKEIEGEAVKQGPIKIGSAVATSSGKLKAKFATRFPTMDFDFKTDEKRVRLAMIAALKKAGELNVSSIAFPALGTGFGGLPKILLRRSWLKSLRST